MLLSTKKTGVIAAVIVITCAVCAVSEEDFEADRPAFTESLETVAPLHLQAEVGAGFSTVGPGNDMKLTSLLIRFGVANNWELRLTAPSLLVHSTDCLEGRIGNGGESGVQPISDRVYERPESFRYDTSPLGISVKGIVHKGGPSRLGFLPYLEIPVRSEHYDSAGLKVGIKGLLQVEIDEIFDFRGSMGMSLLDIGARESDLALELLASVGLMISISEQFGTFVELYGLANEEVLFNPFLGTGLTAMAAPCIQIDFSLALGLKNIERFADIILGVGGSFSVI